MGTAERLCDTVLMIFEGRKVLYGSLAEIQRSYPVRSVRLRLTVGKELPGDLPGISAASRDGAFHVLTLANGTAPQEVLRHVAASREVEHFEVVRPTLHDIFVDIARPPAGALESP
jgi:ABC-2 type transport system ATP-binding protein